MQKTLEKGKIDQQVGNNNKNMHGKNDFAEGSKMQTILIF